MRSTPDFSFEEAAFSRGLSRVCGVDEAGRGPLAGPVVAAAVVLDPANTPAGIDDSKRLKQRARESLAAAILASALHYHVAVVSSGDVDRLNILQATMRAMALAADGIDATLGEIRVDGNRAPTLTARHERVPVKHTAPSTTVEMKTDAPSKSESMRGKSEVAPVRAAREGS